MDTLQKYTRIKDLLMSTDMWQAMTVTVENSPFHREANVAVHTEMVVQHFIENFMEKHTPKDQMIGLLALLFHDTGKPGAREEVYSEARGNYVRFSGHEQVSARCWEDFAMTHWDFFVEVAGLTGKDFYTITWMIENHLPYATAKPEKVRSYLNTVVSIFDNTDLLYDTLIADTYGRISDDAETKQANVHAWVAKMKAGEPESVEHDDFLGSTIVMLIGASGSGKSTWTSANPDFTVYSWDELRVKFATENGIESSDPVEQYRAAFALCNENKAKFEEYQRKAFMWFITRGQNIAIDNTNLSRKARANFIVEAKKRGYKVVAQLFPITRAELLRRQSIRTDKRIPLEAVNMHYNRLSVPDLGGEVHEVVVNLTNV